jgi:alkylation response protein AidB-like acyl-CoA dehydrogenase
LALAACVLVFACGRDSSGRACATKTDEDERAIPLLCAGQVGGCQAVFDLSVLYSQTRVAFGQPIGRFQFVQQHLINIVDALDAARWTTYEAIWKLEDDKEDARASVHLAKAVTSDGYHAACNASHELHAGIGVALEYGLTLHTKASRGLYSYLGDPDYHKQRMTDALGW